MLLPPSLGGFAEVLAAARPASSVGDLIPTLALALVAGSVLVVAASAPRVQQNKQERKADWCAFIGRADTEVPDDGDDADGPKDNGGERPLWGNLDFSIYEAEPGPGDSA